jgi:sugar lactone lactonase YvrE
MIIRMVVPVHRLAPHLAGAVASIIAALGVLACSSSGTTGPVPGKLILTINAPKSITPSVTVTGPGGFSRTLNATTTLSGLAAGTYTVTAAPDTTIDPIVGTVYTAIVSGNPATVSATTGAQANATYNPQPGSGGLWITSDSGTPSIQEYSAAQLANEKPASAAATIGVPSTPAAPAFDASGNLWVPLTSQNAIVEYTATQLGASGSPTPAITLHANAGSLNAPAVLAFDTSGNLWVTNSGAGANSVVQFAANQLALSGSPVPTVTIGASANSLSGPSGMAFDAHGDLWVGNVNNATVVEFTSNQLAATGAPTPAITLLNDTLVGSIHGPRSLAFDSHGNLWVANANGNTIAQIEAGDLTSSGTPHPEIILRQSVSIKSIDEPTGLAFDNFGDLWVSNFLGPSAVVVFSKAEVGVGGSLAPIVVVSHGALGAAAGLAFNLTPPALPLK